MQAANGVRMASVVFLEDSRDLQRLMSLLLKAKLGIECICLSHVSELIERAAEVLRQDIAILDINLGPDEPSGIDAYNWLKENGFRGKILFLTGHAKSSPLVTKARGSGIAVLEKPLKSETLVSTIEHLGASP